ncbi:MAG: hypothetical protein ACOC2W_04000 [bacterium]
MNILNYGETGTGILIENDAGFITKNLNESNKILKESFEFNPDEPILINCILQKYGVPNRNNRIYPEKILKQQVEMYQEAVANNSAVSEADHPECVLASESQILTKEGWKNFEDISEKEEVLTLNNKTNKIETQQINKKIYEQYSGEMYKITHRNMEATLTPNHRILLENKKGERFYITIEELYNDENILKKGQHKILKLGEWNSNNDYDKYFVLNGVNNDYLSYNSKKIHREVFTKDLKIKSEDWFAFLGIYLADGHCGGTVCGKERITGFDVVITQTKHKTQKQIENY